MGKVIMYERIYSDILDKIRNHEYQTGDKLPSEMELAQEYGVSRITSKKAMDLLAEKKYIVRNPGRGSFVSDRADVSVQAAKQEQNLQKEPDNSHTIIGVVFDTFGSDFGGDLLRSIERECSKEGYTILFRCSYGSIEEENEAIRNALELGAKGLILMCAQGEIYNDTILRLALNKFPMVLVDRQMKGISIPCVKTDNYASAKDITKLLIGHGHKNICFVSHSSISTPTIRDRYDGFTDCILEYQDVKGTFEQMDTYNPTPEDVGKEYRAFNLDEIEHIIRNNEECTAFLAAEYKIGALFRRAVKKLKLDKEVAAFDGLAPIYENGHECAHVMQNETAMGVEAVKALTGVMHGEAVPDIINLPYEIVKK